MTLSPLQRNLLIGAGLVALVVITIMATLLLSPARPAPASPEPYFEDQLPAEKDPATLALEAMDLCDRLASDPNDPARIQQPVTNETMAIGQAVDTCQDAVARNPEIARAHYQLGRALWLSNRDQDAVLEFSKAGELGYAAAFFALGEAYMTGRGVPGGERNAAEGLNWYRAAVDAGHPLGVQAVEEAQAQIRRDTFDPASFQNPGFMRRLVEGRLTGVEFPISFAAYRMGLAAALDSNESIFIDQTCRPLINKVGLTAIELEQVGARLESLLRVAGANSGEDVLGNILQYLAQNATAEYAYDQGYRDGITLFDKDVYGCKSRVAEAALTSLMHGTRQF